MDWEARMSMRTQIKRVIAEAEAITRDPEDKERAQQPVFNSFIVFGPDPEVGTSQGWIRGQVYRIVGND